jgi:pyridoxamine 5'-phosphate oxidase
MSDTPDAALDSPPDDPFSLFDRWYGEASRAEHHETTAMTLATSDADGRVSARVVLLKHHDRDGFVFYTNLGSRKSGALQENPHAALLFWFPVLQRQIRIEGVVTPVSEADADAYFASRPRGSQLGAWASDQSRPLEDRATLERRLEDLKQRYDGQTVPRPPHWGGWRLAPDWFEFWHEGAARLHDRITYTSTTGGWTIRRLYP